MAKIITADFQRHDGEDLEQLLCRAIEVAQQRAGMTRAQMAAAVNRRCQRNPGLTAASIAAYVRGDSRPRIDVYVWILKLSGLDVEKRLLDFIAGAGLVLLAVIGAMEATAPISPWW